MALVFNAEDEGYDAGQKAPNPILKGTTLPHPNRLSN